MAARKKKNKRKKTNRRKRKNILVKLNSAQLRNTGRQLFEIGKFADALSYFKELYSREGDEETLRLLSRAYLKRIEELQSKNMSREALVIADNMFQQCGSSLDPAEEIILLCQCHKYERAVILFQEKQEIFSREKQDELEELFGAVALAGNEQILKSLPRETSLCSYFPRAMAALTAFCRQDFSLAETELKTISYRSPYRNFRTLVSGLLAMHDDPEQGQRIVMKIPRSSPYFELIDIFSMQGKTVQEKVEQLFAARNTDRFQQLLAVSGLNYDQGRLLLKIYDTPPTACKAMLRLLVSHSRFFPNKVLQQVGRKLLLYCPEPEPAFFRILHGISPIELCRIEALMYELLGEQFDALFVWDDYMEQLPETTPDYSHRKALVLRRQAELFRRLPFHEKYNHDGGLHRLLESVEFDPDDRQTWLDIIRLSRKKKSATQAYRIVNRAVEQFPEDVEFLLEAIKATFQRGAFKKAAGLAERLLKIDPINVQVKVLLARAHIAHGHKLCHLKKYGLAEKEFSRAHETSGSITLAGRSVICLAMLAFLQKDHKKGEALLQQGMNRCFSPLVGSLLAALEARIIELPKARLNAFDQSLRTISQDAVCSKKECYELVVWQQESYKDERPGLIECFRILKSYFTRSAELSWSEKEARQLAEAFYISALYPQLKKLVDRQLKTVPEDLYFRFMKIVAFSRNGTKAVSREFIDELWEIQDQASFTGDLILRARADDLYWKCKQKDSSSDDGVNSADLDNIFTVLRSAENNRRFEPKNKESSGDIEQLDFFDFFGGSDA